MCYLFSKSVWVIYCRYPKQSGSGERERSGVQASREWSAKQEVADPERSRERSHRNVLDRLSGYYSNAAHALLTCSILHDGKIGSRTATGQ